MRQVGLITAAGASSRMGVPKALLRLPNGQTLAEHQSAFLKETGCADVVIVLGSDAERIAEAIPSCRTTVNEQWEKGRITSVQAGLRALRDYDGCFIIPIDAAGVQPDTLRAVRKMADTGDFDAVRPTHNEQPGYVVWISAHLTPQIVDFQGDSDTPLNQILAPHTRHLPVNDPAILRNINTPEEWAAFLSVSRPAILP